MSDIWHSLGANFALVAVFFAVWAFVQLRIENLRRPARHALLGFFMGCGAVASMLTSFQIHPGFFLDLRTPLIVVAAFMGGPISALIAGSMAALYRFAMGGDGLAVGLISILLSCLIGTVGFVARRGKAPTYLGILALALTISGVSILLMLFTVARMGQASFPQAGTFKAVLGFIATIVAGMFILEGKRLANRLDILRAAFVQAPDFHSLKDRRGKFMLVNENVATHHGFSRPSEMIGSCDRDLVEPERAEALLNAERDILSSGVGQFDIEECIVGEGGEEKWFLTSKVPLRNPDGEIIGIASTTREVTEKRRLEAELIDSRELLSRVVGEISDGLAMFDRMGFLVYCNENYRGLFPRTSDVRVPGTHIRTILRAVINTNEQININDSDRWIEDVTGSLQRDGEEHVSLFDGRWLSIRTRPTIDGASMVVVSDVTSFKSTERELLSMTSRLKVLATTDGLTGLMNRRAFDAAIEKEVFRSQSEERPISLVMFDVDFFKAYNDHFGHPAGDECLRVISSCLQQSVRQGDLLARYGGEEFVAILPDADEDRAFGIAERVRNSLFAVGIPNPASPYGVVTISAGIASHAGPARRVTSQMISRADEALYTAKSAGRNRTTGWRARHGVKAG